MSFASVFEFAGLTCSITVRFSPKTREDIHDHISVLAHTGPVEIPLNCTSKKALPVIQASVVDVGTVTMGETGTSYVVLENKVLLLFLLCLRPRMFEQQ